MEKNKTGKYLKYALGEIALVVIGILIALQVNNWNENRKNINKASELKSRLIKDITADIETMDKRFAFFESVRSFGFNVEKELITPKATTAENQWKFIVDVFHTSQLWDFTPVSTAYNEIQNLNLLGYIGSNELSDQLSQYYIQAPIQLNQIIGGTAEYRDYTRSIIPIKIQEYIWKHCYSSELLGTQLIIKCQKPDTDFQIIESIYQSISSDQNFKKLLTNRLSTIYVRNELYQINIRLAESIISNIKSDQ
jgi:hypothetical protein